MPMPGLSPAAADLGIGLGDMLRTQVQDETEEQRRKRLMQMTERATGGGSPAVGSLFGGLLGPGT